MNKERIPGLAGRVNDLQTKRDVMLEMQAVTSCNDPFARGFLLGRVSSACENMYKNKEMDENEVWAIASQIKNMGRYK